MSKFGTGNYSQLRLQHAAIGTIREIGLQPADHVITLGLITQRDRGEADQSIQGFLRAHPAPTKGDES